MNYTGIKPKANQDVRNYAKQNRVFWWMIADEMGISYDTLIRKLRKEMTDAQKQDIKKIVDRMVKLYK